MTKPRKPPQKRPAPAPAGIIQSIERLREQRAQVVETLNGIDVRTTLLVRSLRGQDVSWSRIGAIFGTSGQAAQQRFGAS